MPFSSQLVMARRIIARKVRSSIIFSGECACSRKRLHAGPPKKQKKSGRGVPDRAQVRAESVGESQVRVREGGEEAHRRLARLNQERFAFRSALLTVRFRLLTVPTTRDASRVIIEHAPSSLPDSASPTHTHTNENSQLVYYL